ncbi:MAG: hypothetical protein Q9227_000194 [Pyrenula ochraceoflavens]
MTAYWDAESSQSPELFGDWGATWASDGPSVTPRPKAHKGQSMSFNVSDGLSQGAWKGKFSSDQSTSSSTFDPPWDKHNILSLDGGGIRGYSSLLIIQKLTDFIVNEEHKQFGTDLDGYEESFDITKHSSYYPNNFLPNTTSDDTDLRDLRETLIAILLGRLRLSVDDALEEYEKMGGFVFGHGRTFSIRGPLLFPRDKYSEKRFVEVVKHAVNTRLPRQTFGDHLFISHERMCKTVAVAFDSQKVEGYTGFSTQGPYLFRSYDHHPNVRGNQAFIPHERNPGYSPRVPIWQVARATSAAPTYFNSITIGDSKYGDGGFGANNPTKEMYFEVCQMNGNAKECIELLISIGTGELKRVERYQEDGASKYLSFLRSARKLASNSELVHDDMCRMLGNIGEDKKYHRLNVPYKSPILADQMRPDTSNKSTSAFPRPSNNPSSLGDMKLDEWRGSTTLESIREATANYLSQPHVQDELRSIAEVLVNRRRSRSRHPEKWDIYSTGIQYRCQHPNCHQLKSQKLRHSKRSLISHLRNKHSVPKDGIEEYVTKGALGL